jgi:hypothetical protein
VYLRRPAGPNVRPGGTGGRGGPTGGPVYNWVREPRSAPQSYAHELAVTESPLVTNSSAEWNNLFRQDTVRRRAANNRGKCRGAR